MFRSAWVTLLAVAVLLCCTGARAAAEGIKDPVIIIAGDDFTRGFSVGPQFSIESPSGTSPVNLTGGSPCVVAGIEVPLCVFSNGTNFTWTTLTFSITPGLQIGPFTCLTLAYFSHCSFSDHNRKVTFSGSTGIAAGKVFLFAVVLWLPKTTFAGMAANAESSTEALSRALLSRAPAPCPQPSKAELIRDGNVALRERGRTLSPLDSGA